LPDAGPFPQISHFLANSCTSFRNRLLLISQKGGSCLLSISNKNKYSTNILNYASLFSDILNVW
jgi:hypothetical protein